MRVGLISFHSFSQPGGVKRHVLGLHKDFKKRGIESKIIVPRRNGSEDYGKDIILLGTSFPIKLSGSQSDFCINFNPLAISEVLEKEKFDVLHFHNFGLPSGFQILERSKSLNILTVHADPQGSRFLQSVPGLEYVFNKIAQWRLDGIIGVASLTLKSAKDFQGPKAIIPNGVDLTEFNPNVPKIKEFSDERINILFVGRIEERKGLIYLLKAYKILEKKFSNLRLIVVGEGSLKKECQKWARENNLKEVNFVGEKVDKELPPYYASSDIFVSPAIFGESFGIVLLEAMASGLPLAAFANQGYKEFMKGKREAGFLVKPREYRTLAQKIAILVDNESLRKEMGERGIKESQNYSWSKIADKILDFYKLAKKYKSKKKENNFNLDKIISKIYNTDILDWFKKPK